VQPYKIFFSFILFMQFEKLTGNEIFFDLFFFFNFIVRYCVLVFFVVTSYFTTRFHSFTDGNIPLVCDYEFVGNLFTDIFTDGLCPSAFPSSVIPNSVAISVGNTKKPFADGFIDGICAPKKSFPLEIY